MFSMKQDQRSVKGKAVAWAARGGHYQHKLTLCLVKEISLHFHLHPFLAHCTLCAHSQAQISASSSPFISPGIFLRNRE